MKTGRYVRLRQIIAYGDYAIQTWGYCVERDAMKVAFRRRVSTRASQQYDKWQKEAKVVKKKFRIQFNQNSLSLECIQDDGAAKSTQGEGKSGFFIMVQERTKQKMKKKRKQAALIALKAKREEQKARFLRCINDFLKLSGALASNALQGSVKLSDINNVRKLEAYLDFFNSSKSSKAAFKTMLE